MHGAWRFIMRQKLSANAMRRKEIESICQEVQHPPDSDASTARASRDFVAELKRRKATLKAAGVTSVDELLERGATPKGREDPAAKSGVPAGQILKFVNYADLFRIKGSAGQTGEVFDVPAIHAAPSKATDVVDRFQVPEKIVDSSRRCCNPSRIGLSASSSYITAVRVEFHEAFAP